MSEAIYTTVQAAKCASHTQLAADVAAGVERCTAVCTTGTTVAFKSSTMYRRQSHLLLLLQNQVDLTSNAGVTPHLASK
jgi:hypothetical protein